MKKILFFLLLTSNLSFSGNGDGGVLFKQKFTHPTNTFKLDTGPRVNTEGIRMASRIPGIAARIAAKLPQSVLITAPPSAGRTQTSNWCALQEHTSDKECKCFKCISHFNPKITTIDDWENHLRKLKIREKRNITSEKFSTLISSHEVAGDILAMKKNRLHNTPRSSIQVDERKKNSVLEEPFYVSISHEEAQPSPLTEVFEQSSNDPGYEQSSDAWVKPGHIIHNFSYGDSSSPVQIKWESGDFISEELNDEDFLKKANLRIDELESKSIN